MEEKKWIMINDASAHIAVPTGTPVKGFSVLKPDLETVPLLNQNGHRGFSQQSGE